MKYDWSKGKSFKSTSDCSSDYFIGFALGTFPNLICSTKWWNQHWTPVPRKAWVGSLDDSSDCAKESQENTLKTSLLVVMQIDLSEPGGSDLFKGRENDVTAKPFLDRHICNG